MNAQFGNVTIEDLARGLSIKYFGQGDWFGREDFPEFLEAQGEAQEPNQEGWEGVLRMSAGTFKGMGYPNEEIAQMFLSGGLPFSAIDEYVLELNQHRAEVLRVMGLALKSAPDASMYLSGKQLIVVYHPQGVTPVACRALEQGVYAQPRDIGLSLFRCWGSF